MDNNSLKNSLQKATDKTMTAFGKALQDAEFRNRCIDVWNDNARMNAQLKALSCHNELLIEKITKEYELKRDFLQFAFRERQTALNAHYVSLDYALKNNDREMIIESLRLISNIVAKNPLSSFPEFTKIWDDKDQTLYLDF